MIENKTKAGRLKGITKQFNGKALTRGSWIIPYVTIVQSTALVAVPVLLVIYRVLTDPGIHGVMDLFYLLVFTTMVYSAIVASNFIFLYQYYLHHFNPKTGLLVILAIINLIIIATVYPIIGAFLGMVFPL